MNYHNRALITFTDIKLAQYNTYNSSHYYSLEYQHIFKIVDNIILYKNFYKYDEKLWKRIHDLL